jgi:hypothetical protein
MTQLLVLYVLLVLTTFGSSHLTGFVTVIFCSSTIVGMIWSGWQIRSFLRDHIELFLTLGMSLAFPVMMTRISATINVGQQYIFPFSLLCWAAGSVVFASLLSRASLGVEFTSEHPSVDHDKSLRFTRSLQR